MPTPLVHRWKTDLRRRLKDLVRPPTPLDRWAGRLRQDGCRVVATPRVTGAADELSRVVVGRGTILEPEVTIWLSPDAGERGHLTLGRHGFIGQHTYFGVHEGITVGDDTLIGAYCYIISANHRALSRRVPIREQGYDGKPVAIADDVWLGTHVVVLPGASIGRGAIVGAGAIVTGHIPPYEIWGGVPARRIGVRPDDTTSSAELAVASGASSVADA